MTILRAPQDSEAAILTENEQLAGINAGYEQRYGSLRCGVCMTLTDGGGG
jgi:hypothetical protein